jgi:hypothetical protein
MLLALVLSLWIFDGRRTVFEPAQTTTLSRHVGGWTLKVTRDKFTHEVSCSMSKGRVEFSNDVLIFHSNPDDDTTDAVFKVDGGPVRSVRDATFEDQRRGYFRAGGPLENPSAGQVALPSHYVTGASWVYIRPTPKHPPNGFDVRGFAGALALARQLQCPGIGP